MRGGRPPEFSRIAQCLATIRPHGIRRAAVKFPRLANEEKAMVKRGMSPFVRETLERVAIGLWFVGILLLLYLTLQSQLARGTEPEPDWDLVALYGGSVDVDASAEARALGGCPPDAAVRTMEPAPGQSRNTVSPAGVAAAWRPAP
jgi:hypothetical protein